MKKKPSKIIIEPVRARAIRGPHKDNAKSWYWRAEYSHDGTTDTLWTGWGTRQAVREVITELIAAHGLDKLVVEAQQRRGVTTSLGTVEDLMRAWFAWWEDNPEAKPATVKTYRRAAKAIVKGLGPVRLARLDLTALERFKRQRIKSWISDQQERLQKTRSALAELEEGDDGRVTLEARLKRQEQRLKKPVLTTLDLDLKALNAAWNWARGRSDGFPRHQLPVKAVAPTRAALKEAVDDDRPTQSQFLKVVSHLSGWSHLAVVLLGATGARKSEIAEARWDGFDPEAGTLVVGGKTSTREVRLPIATIALLLEIRPEDARGRILGDVAVSTIQSGLATHVRAACVEAEVPYFTVHAIRRMVTDLLYASGCDPASAAKQLGHSVRVALEHYRRASLEDMGRAVELAGLGAQPGECKVVSLDERRRSS